MPCAGIFGLGVMMASKFNGSVEETGRRSGTRYPAAIAGAVILASGVRRLFWISLLKALRGETYRTCVGLPMHWLANFDPEQRLEIRHDLETNQQ